MSIDNNDAENPTKIAFLIAIFIKKGKCLYVFNEKRNDPVKYPSLYAVPLIETTTSESNVAILIQSKKLKDNEFSPILYNAHSIIDRQPQLKKYKKLYKKQKLALSPTAVNLSIEEQTHKRYQELLEIVMDDCSKFHKQQKANNDKLH